MLVILGCATTSTATPGAGPTPTPTPTLSPTAALGIPSGIVTTPFLSVEEPADGSVVVTEEVIVRGSARPGDEVRLSVLLGQDVRFNADQNGKWEHKAKLKKGKNEFDFFLQEAQDIRARLTLTYEPPIAQTSAPTTVVPSATKSVPILTPASTPKLLPTATPEPTSTPKPAPVATPVPTATPTSATNGVHFVTVQGGPPGGNASVTVQTAPEAKCFITYTTPSGTTSKAEGLDEKVADSNGFVTWEWKIGPSTKQGKGDVTVTCNSAKAATEIEIG